MYRWLLRNDPVVVLIYPRQAKPCAMQGSPSGRNIREKVLPEYAARCVTEITDPGAIDF